MAHLNSRAALSSKGEEEEKKRAKAALIFAPASDAARPLRVLLIKMNES